MVTETIIVPNISFWGDKTEIILLCFGIKYQTLFGKKNKCKRVNDGRFKMGEL